MKSDYGTKAAMCYNEVDGKYPSSTEVYSFFVQACKGDYTLPDGKHEQNRRVVLMILIANAILQHGDSYYGGLVMLHRTSKYVRQGIT